AAGRGGPLGGANPSASHFDDLVCLHPRSRAPGICDRRRIKRPALGGNDCVWRDDHVHDVESLLHSGALPHHRRLPREKKGHRFAGIAQRRRLTRHERVRSLHLSLTSLTTCVGALSAKIDELVMAHTGSASILGSKATAVTAT